MVILRGRGPVTALALSVMPALALAAGALAGCNAVANVDLTYSDAGQPAEEAGSADGGGGGATSDAPVFPVKDAASVVTSTTVPCQGADGAVCDQTQGLGCCMPSGGGAAFCVDQGSAKAACSGGVFMGCVKSDSTSESECCWNGSGAGSFTAYAGSCGARPFACSTTEDCPSGSACNTITCHGLTVGACGVTPACP